MATKRGPTKVTKKKNWTEFRFEIDAYSPSTMPLDRLTEYLTELVKILGEPKNVHLMAIQGGSTAPLLRVDREADPKVRGNVAAVRAEEARPDAMRSYRHMNAMLRADNAVGSLTETGKKRPLIRFPGREERIERAITVHQYGTIDGELQHIGGKSQTTRAILEAEGRTVTDVKMSRATAKRLSPHLFDFVRLSGDGTWVRDPDGEWHLKEFQVEDFKVLKRDRLGAVVANLRKIGLDLDSPDLLGEMTRLRHGPEGDDARH
jgi:hypothetical protein